ncbi:MAG TPA: hypothetical protein VFQ63_03355, partial [Patescibacteria group bacterium]|nr:hypothetical protein [Patescibacteria group bacterium]
MSKKVTIDQGVLLILYYKYKDYLVPLGTIFVCILLFFFLLLPQFQDYLAAKDTLASDEQTVEILNQNLSTISNLNQAQVNTNLLLASAALPSEKDFAGVLNAISDAASTSNVGVGDYTFQVGDLSKSSEVKSSTGELIIQISLTLMGTLTDTKRFVHVLTHELPLSEVKSVDLSGDGSANLSVSFFYNPFPPIQFNDTSRLPVLSRDQLTLLKTLSTQFTSLSDASGIAPATASSASAS